MALISALPGHRSMATVVAALAAAAAVIAVSWLVLSVARDGGAAGIQAPSSVIVPNGDPPLYEDDGPGRGRPWKDIEQ